MRKKTFLAIAFASGLLNSPQPASSQNESKPTDPVSKNNSNPTDLVIQQIADNARLKPEMRAFYLLQMASRYLGGQDKTAVEAQFKSIATVTTSSVTFDRRNRTWEGNLKSFADYVSEDRSIIQRNKKPEATPDPLSISDQDLALADTAIEKALLQLDQVTEKFAKWNIYYIASRLFRKMDNVAGTQKCDKILEEAFHSCEVSSTVSEDQVKAAVSILNSMGNGFVPVQIWDRTIEGEDSTLQQQQIKSITEKHLEASEKLKQRAATIADRLPATADVRRRTHRDLVFWYTKFGRSQMALKEKQVLFELVGIKDDRILYPQPEGCGSVVWWVIREKGITSYDCGMG